MSQTKSQLLNPLSGNINVTGVITASSFVGSGEGLTGVASTDNIQTATEATFLSGVKITGVTTASGGVVGNLTGNVTGNATGLSGTPNITVGSVSAASGSFSGNVTIGGTLTYTDVTNIDSVGIITAQQGIQVLANGVDVTGIGTFEDRITYDGSLGQSGGAQVTYAVTVASKDSTHRYPSGGGSSSNGYVIDNLQAPVLTLTPGRTYFFDQSDSSNNTHPLRFYLEADKTTQYTTNVTAGSISAGTAGAGVTIVIGDSTPNVLHYQCSAHGYMGNSAISQSNVAGALNVVDESSDTSCNVLFTTDATGTALAAKTGTNLTFNSSTGALTATSFEGDGSNLTGIEAGITTTEKTISANSTVFLGLSTAQHHTINLVAGITTIDCTGGSVGESHSVVLINPSSIGTGVTIGFATDFLFPSGSEPSLPTGANAISLISFVVKQTGAGGTEVLASAGLNYSN